MNIIKINDVKLPEAVGVSIHGMNRVCISIHFSPEERKKQSTGIYATNIKTIDEIQKLFESGTPIKLHQDFGFSCDFKLRCIHIIYSYEYDSLSMEIEGELIE